MLSDLCGSLRQFGLEARPYLLMIVIVFSLKQPECFLRAELRDAGKVFDPEPIQYLGSLQVPRTQTQRALNRFGRHWWSRSHVSSVGNIRT
jgi:hypothetical protein